MDPRFHRSSSGCHQGERRIPVVIRTLGGLAPFELAFVVQDLETAAQRFEGRARNPRGGRV